MFTYSINLPGAARVRGLSPHEFCKQGFVIGKSSEAGFGNEMYKILTAAALSIMLNRSLIIGQTRHIYSLSSLFFLNYLIFCFMKYFNVWTILFYGFILVHSLDKLPYSGFILLGCHL